MTSSPLKPTTLMPVESLLNNNLSQPVTPMEDAKPRLLLPKSSKLTWTNIQKTTSFQTLELIMMLLLPKATTETPVESLCKRNRSQPATQIRDAPLTLPPHGNIKELIQFTKFQYSQHQPVLPFIHIHQHSCNLMNKT
jgi:hypothetical protein